MENSFPFRQFGRSCFLIFISFIDPSLGNSFEACRKQGVTDTGGLFNCSKNISYCPVCFYTYEHFSSAFNPTICSTHTQPQGSERTQSTGQPHAAPGELRLFKCLAYVHFSRGRWRKSSRRSLHPCTYLSVSPEPCTPRLASLTERATCLVWYQYSILTHFKIRF